MSIHFKLSYDGQIVYRWYGVDTVPGVPRRYRTDYIDLRVQTQAPCRPEKFSEGVWPKQIQAMGTVARDIFACDGLPPKMALMELWTLIRKGYLRSLEHANRVGYPADLIPTCLVPVYFSMDRHMFINAQDQPAYQGCRLKG